MANFLVFTGTTEGRRLVELLSRAGAEVCASVATEYGGSLLPEGVRVFAERLDAEGMTTLLENLRFDCVIDATHPYAREVTENLRTACATSGTRYLRLRRPESPVEGCVYVESAEQAAEVLAATTGRVLLTTGSKELDRFTRVPDYQNRLFPRVLPTIESIQRCLALGYQVRNLIAMQGPFSRELNGAMMRQTGAAILVTKESGDAGGFLEKLGAAQDTGAVAVVIGRPRDAGGCSFDEAVETLAADYGLNMEPEEPEDAPCFPFFARLTGRRAVLFGGGTVAARRAAVLAQFGAALTVVTPQADPAIGRLGVRLLNRPYQRGDCVGYDYALAATGSREVNRAVYEEARHLHIPVNVSDAPEECDFYFPGIVRRGNLVIGVTASGTDHVLARRTARTLRERLAELIPEEEDADGEP